MLPRSNNKPPDNNVENLKALSSEWRPFRAVHGSLIASQRLSGVNRVIRLPSSRCRSLGVIGNSEVFRSYARIMRVEI